MVTFYFIISLTLADSVLRFICELRFSNRENIMLNLPDLPEDCSSEPLADDPSLCWCGDPLPAGQEYCDTCLADPVVQCLLFN